MNVLRRVGRRSILSASARWNILFSFLHTKEYINFFLPYNTHILSCERRVGWNIVHHSVMTASRKMLAFFSSRAILKLHVSLRILVRETSMYAHTRRHACWARLETMRYSVPSSWKFKSFLESQLRSVERTARVSLFHGDMARRNFDLRNEVTIDDVIKCIVEFRLDLS